MGGGQTAEYRIRNPDGDWQWVRDMGNVVDRDADGEPTRAVGVQLDIDDRKRAQLTVQRERDMFTEGPAVLLRWRDEPGWPIEYVSKNVTEVLGYDPDALVDGSIDYADIVHEDDLERVRRQTERYRTEGRGSHDPYRVYTADGDVRWVIEYTTVVDDDSGDDTQYLGYLVDITERKHREQQLEAARDELRQVIDLVPDPVHIRDADGRFILANEAAADCYGTTPGELEGQTGTDPDTELEAPDACDRDIAAVADSGEPMAAERELPTGDGDTRTLETTRIPYETTRTDEPAVLTYARDVTELKAYERTLERQRDSLETLNQVVRHDIRNSLQLVTAYADLLDDHVDGDAAEFVAHISDAAENAVDITETARDVTEVLLRSATELTAVDIADVVETQADHVRTGYEHVTVEVDSVPDCAVVADEMLESILRNLLSNAVQHNDKDRPVVSVSATADDDTVCLCIADNGPGIPDKHKAQIFEEGETGLESDGTGLGLYLVETLIARYGGDVRIEDNDPEGSAFIVELRRAE